MSALKSQCIFTNQRKTNVNNVEINYSKVGYGPHTLLCLHGVLGSIHDFSLLTENLNLQKYTIVVWEAPGCGKSRPPNRDVSPGIFHRDADLAISLMETLHIDKYSVLGWCGGGITALIMASKVVDRVEKLVVWSCNAFATERDVGNYETIRDIRSWHEYPRQIAIETYGEEYVMEKWNAWIDSYRSILDERNGNICREALSDIIAPTLILHGVNDPLIPVDHAVYLHEYIDGSSLEIFPDLGHFLYCERFYSKVDNFLSTK